MPFVWCIPEALVTAELGSAYPEAAGGIAWVKEAFGGRTAFVAGYFTWLSGSTDNAIYPVLFYEYLMHHVSGDDEEEDDVRGLNKLNPAPRFFILAGTALLLSYINFRGLHIAGKLSVAICIMSMSPFIVMCIMGIPKVDASRWFETPLVPSGEISSGLDSRGWLPLANVGNVLWRPFLNNLFWNLNDFDSAAHLAGEVNNPGVVFPSAMFLAIFLVFSAYLLPLLVGLGATESEQTDWREGYFAVIAAEIGGRWLGTWTVIAAGISNLALYQSALSMGSFQLLGMAERNMIPKVFATRSQHGTPTYGILLVTFIICTLVVTDFSNLVEMLNFTYAVSLLTEYAAFIKLRITRSDRKSYTYILFMISQQTMDRKQKQSELTFVSCLCRSTLVAVPRPYRIPFGTTGCILMLTPAVLTIIVIMMLATWMTWIYCAISVGVALAMHFAQECSLARAPAGTPDPKEVRHFAGNKEESKGLY
jgi:amino acid transporter